MVEVLLLIAILLLCLFIALAARAIRYYTAPYARATKRDFLVTLRSAHAWEQHCLAQKLAKRYGKDCQLLFDVAVPYNNASSAWVDVVLLVPQGIAAFFVQGGRGRVYGALDDKKWVLVTSEKDDEVIMVPNMGAQVLSATHALQEYLLLEDAASGAVVPIVELGGRLRDDGVEVPGGVSVATGRTVVQVLDQAFAAQESPDDEAALLSEEALKRMYRALKACSNAEVANFLSDSDVEAGDADAMSGVASRAAANAKLDPTSWMRQVVQRGREDSTSAELVRKADKLASSKEDFDALTWDRIMEISAELDSKKDPERLAELAAELRLIARTNVSLNYRFGIAQAAEDAALSPAGLVMESSVGELTGTPPDPELHEALQAADEEGFFDTQDTAEDEQGESSIAHESGIADDKNNKKEDES